MPTYDLATRVAAGTTYRARAYAATAVPTTFERHVLEPDGLRLLPRHLAAAACPGRCPAVVRRPARPGLGAGVRVTDSLVTWFPRVADAPATRAARNDTRSYGAWEYARDIGNYTTLRRMYSQRQVLETMVDFWNNHLHVPVNANRSWVMRWDYDQTVRSHALGRFEDLLVACSLHPSMLLYLDNAPVGARRPQREPGPRAPRAAHPGAHLGLHRADGQGLGEDPVGMDRGRGPVGGVLRPSRHTTGPVQVLGFTDRERLRRRCRPRRRATCATWPTTRPPPGWSRGGWRSGSSPTPRRTPWSTELARVFTASGTDIAATLRALVASDEFAASAGQKVRTPVDDLVATVRVLGVTASAPRSQASFATAIAYLPRSMLLYSWPRPDGAPETNADWASAGPACWRRSGCTGCWPAATTPTAGSATASRPPGCRSRRCAWTCTSTTCAGCCSAGPSTSRDLRAVCQATGRGPAETVTSRHPLASYLFVRMAIVLLDSPDHMSR